jgi:enoyl-CoA hydratase
MEYQTISLSTRDRIAYVTINRPDKHNALNRQVMSELENAFAKIQNDASVDVVVLAGSGEKAFVAGADIKELNQLEALSGKEFSESGQWVFNQIENLGKPVIAAVNGYALGGGCELALACHIRVASENARFGQPEVSLGIIPGYGGTQRLARLIGKGRALEMILTGNQIDAQGAYRIGLVNKVVRSSELLSAAETIAKAILSKGQAAIRGALEAVNAGMETAQTDGQRIESTLFGKLCGTEDFKERTAAFLEKRKPEFKNHRIDL